VHHSGCKEIETPHIDRLAAGGARFANAFAATPVCSPSRATYMTGRLPSHHGIQDFLMSAVDCIGPTAKQFLAGQPTFSESLAKAGYKVGLAGKWHMGADATMQAGFSYWATVPGAASTFRDAVFVKNGETVKTSGMKTDRVGDFAIEFIDQSKHQPFCLFVPFYAPHTPYDHQSEEYRKPYEKSPFSCFPRMPQHPRRMTTLQGRRTATLDDHGNVKSMLAYSALVTAADHNMGRVLAHLDKLGLRNNTLVIFSADQGHNSGHHGLWGKGNATIPFNMYEESVRVPLIWNLPGRIKAGKVQGQLVSSYDFMPSLLDYLGVDPPADRHRVGRSYAPLLRGERYRDREEIFFEYGYVRAVRSKRWKYVERVDGFPSELFDLQTDPGEAKDLFGTPEGNAVAKGMSARLRAFFDGAGAPPPEQWRSTTRQALPRYNDPLL
jgi:arylsulfatase A-like enzyme